jgi:Zn-dependent protease
VAILLISGVHGYTVAAMAAIRGDLGPTHGGRRTINPFAHFDVIGAVCLLLFGLGWARPVLIEASQLRAPRRDLMATTLTSLLAVLALGLAAYLLRPIAIAALPLGLGTGVTVTLEVTVNLAMRFAIFNLIPMPPLTGRYLLTALLPPATRGLIDKYMVQAAVVVAALIASDLLARLLDPPIRRFTAWVLGYL